MKRPLTTTEIVDQMAKQAARVTFVSIPYQLKAPRFRCLPGRAPHAAMERIEAIMRQAILDVLEVMRAP